MDPKAALLAALQGGATRRKKKKLKPTTIRVRTRTNEVFYERLESEGAVQVVGKAKEAYVKSQLELDAEEGLTRLKPQYWDTKKQRWGGFNFAALSIDAVSYTHLTLPTIYSV